LGWLLHLDTLPAEARLGINLINPYAPFTLATVAPLPPYKAEAALIIDQ
jgi:hypothetical protein